MKWKLYRNCATAGRAGWQSEYLPTASCDSVLSAHASIFLRKNARAALCWKLLKIFKKLFSKSFLNGARGRASSRPPQRAESLWIQKRHKGVNFKPRRGLKEGKNTSGVFPLVHKPAVRCCWKRGKINFGSKFQNQLFALLLFITTAGLPVKFRAYIEIRTISYNFACFKYGPIPHPLPVNREGEFESTNSLIKYYKNHLCKNRILYIFRYIY